MDTVTAADVLRQALKLWPRCEIAEDAAGQLVINTGLYQQSGTEKLSDSEEVDQQTTE